MGEWVGGLRRGGWKHYVIVIIIIIIIVTIITIIIIIHIFSPLATKIRGL